MLPVMFEEWVIKLHHQNPGILLGGSTLHLDIVKKKNLPGYSSMCKTNQNWA
jgi:hypothetical protein